MCVASCREVKETGGLTSGVRDDILNVMDSLIKQAGEIDTDSAVVFSQILVSML